MSPQDAAKVGVADNDWIEAVNRNGVIVARARCLPPYARGHGVHVPRPGPGHRRAPGRDIRPAGRYSQLAEPGC
jgi:anaerobic selenocysteine-containing dehydrogenase